MRPTIVLLSCPEDHQSLVARLQGAGKYSKGEFFDRLEWGGCSFGVDTSQDVLGEFEEDELCEIRRVVGEAFLAVALEYSRVSCVRDLLVEVLPGTAGLLDTNYGELVEFSEVLSRFRKEPLWDWCSAMDG
jgi:hypothetical protein